METPNPEIVIFWFRRDLRITDNHGLFKAFQTGYPVLPIFIFDKDILEKLSNKEDTRVDFIHQSLKEIQLQCAENESTLLVLHDNPLHAFETIISTYNVKGVYTNNDYEPDAINRDLAVSAYLNKNGIEFRSFKDQVVFEKDEVLKGDGKPYTIFTPYSRIWKEKLSQVGIQHYPSENNLNGLFKTAALPIPSLGNLGFTKTNIQFHPAVLNYQLVGNYHLTRNLPAVDGTTKLSVHLRFGTISPRQLVKKARELNEQWLNELIWREFFMMILYHFPNVVDQSFKPKYDFIEWRNREDEFAKWCNGTTGFPIVDAGMRELNETGFMHNRVRMIVASFLTKDLLIDWRWGAAYFAEKLLDYDLSANNGNWQWAAGSGCDSAPYFRIFNPNEQVKKFDPEWLYIKKWIKNLDDNYPLPMIDHDWARKRCLVTYKKGLMIQE